MTLYTAAEAADPNVAPPQLAEMATNQPELRAIVAANPACYPELLTWLTSLNDPEINRAIEARQSAGAPSDGSPLAGDQTIAASSAVPDYGQPAAPPAYGQPTGGQPSYGQPTYGQPAAPSGYGQPAQPVYGQPVQPAQPVYAQPAQPVYAQSVPPVYTQPGYAVAGYSEQKSRTVAGILGILLGGIGVHRFYMGYVGIGLVQILVTFITLGAGALWGLIEGIIILVGSGLQVDAKGVPLRQ